MYCLVDRVASLCASCCAGRVVRRCPGTAHTRRPGMRRRCPGLRLDPVAGVAGLCRAAVRRGLAGRPPSAVPDRRGCGRWSTAWRWRCTARRGRSTARSAPRRGTARLPADLPRPDAAVPVRLAHHRAAGAGLAQPAHRFHRRLHLLALRALAPAGGAGDGDRADRRGAVPRAAVQGGGDEPRRADRPGRRRTGSSPTPRCTWRC